MLGSPQNYEQAARSAYTPSLPCSAGRLGGAILIPVLLEERDPLGWVMKALREAGGSIITEFAGLDEDALRTRPGEGDLCLKEIAAHLRDSEELALRQVTSLLERPERTIPFWDVDVLPLERDYVAMDLHMLLMEFRSLRRETSALLWGLTEREWRREGKHPYKGSITLEEIAQELARHDLEHLWQVRRLKADLGADAPSSGDW